MGCVEEQQKIKDQMMLLKLERLEIRNQKKNQIKLLEQIEGHSIQRDEIPDYIDPHFARAKNIATDYHYINQIKIANTTNKKDINKDEKVKGKEKFESTDKVKKKKIKKNPDKDKPTTDNVSKNTNKKHKNDKSLEKNKGSKKESNIKE